MTNPRTLADKFKKRYGKFVEIDDREWQQEVGACASKAVRNSVLDGLPAGLIEEYVAEARRVVAPQERKDIERAERGKKPESKADVIRQRFGTYGLSERDIRGIINNEVSSLDDLNEDHLVTLRGVMNALKDAAVQAEELRSTAAPVLTGALDPSATE